MNKIGAVPITFKEELLKAQKLSTAIYKLTHELKNPLSVCNGYLEMMEYCDDRKRDKYLSIITEEIRRSIHIINDYSEFGKIKKLEKEVFDFSFLMEEVSEKLRDLFKTKQAKIIYNYQQEHFLYGDYRRIEQVMINLLKNSFESRNKDCLWVKVIVKEYQTKTIISVQDNGKGMNDKELNQLRKEFYTTKKHGTGLGIPFCEEIMSLHAGNLHIYSKEGMGTRISLSFPKQKKSEDF